ncbi:MAG: HAMP domain-containing histidine kinase [Deltaproteobacteria bacterium]|nr:HAMP domain-containing histidine kinase [Deltaproteobacteria bacterium]
MFQSKMGLEAIFGRQTIDRMYVAGRLISHDLTSTPRIEWSDVLTRFSEIHQVHFALLLEDGSVFLSKNLHIPDDLLRRLMDTFPLKRPQNESRPPFMHDHPREEPKGDPPHDRMTIGQGSFELRFFDHNEPPDGAPRIMIHTKNPTQYWARIIIPVSLEPWRPAEPAMLIAESESITGNGFFFDPLPWMFVAGAVLFISVLLWIPLGRSITRPLARMTAAAEEIAGGRFDVRIHEAGADEIGRLGKALNYMTLRLHGFVNGQKRFLGDAAHELGSPIARIQIGLGILEQRIDPWNKERVKDVMEDVTHMSNLVNELLSFSRAEMSPTKVQLEAAKLFPLVERAVQRECPPEAKIMINVDADTQVIAAPELLTRALANLIRNAVKYAGNAGPIVVNAKREKDQVVIVVRDTGPGVPEEIMSHLFEPFIRPEPSRDRETGGVGLGLAIVKTCVDACKGSVTAENLKPTGFAVTISLNTGC